MRLTLPLAILRKQSSGCHNYLSSRDRSRSEQMLQISIIVQKWSESQQSYEFLMISSRSQHHILGSFLYAFLIEDELAPSLLRNVNIRSSARSLVHSLIDQLLLAPSNPIAHKSPWQIDYRTIILIYEEAVAFNPSPIHSHRPAENLPARCS